MEESSAIGSARTLDWLDVRSKKPSPREVMASLDDQPFDKEQKRLRRLLDEARQEGRTPDDSLLQRCGRHGLLNEVLAFLDENRGVAVEAAIAACVPSGRWQQALSLITDLQNEGLEISQKALYHSIRACSRGAWRNGLKLLGIAGELALDPDSRSYAAAMAACRWEERQRSVAAADAMLLYDEFMSLSNAAAGSQLIREAAQACEDGGLWTRALSLLEIAPAQIYGFVYSSVVRNCAEASQWEVAVSLLLSSTGVADVSAHCAGLIACRVRGHWEEAEALLEALQVAPQVHGRRSRPFPARRNLPRNGMSADDTRRD